MKNFDAFKNTGLGITELSNPTENMEIDATLVDLVKQTIKEVYQMEVPIEAL
jgi:hypothetical protein